MLWVVAADIPIHILDHAVTVVSAKQLQTLLLNAFNLHRRGDMNIKKILGLRIRWVLPAPHSSTLAWKIPRMEEPGGLQSMGSLRVGHDSVTSLSLFTFMHWRRKWQPTPVFLQEESQGWGSPVGCRPWGHTESDTTEAT